MTIDEKLDNFYNSAINDATVQSQSMLDEYKASLQKIFDEHKEDMLRKAKNTLRVETDNLIRERNKTLSTESIDIKRTVSEKSRELKDDLFSKVYNKLMSFKETSQYVSLLEQQIKKENAFARQDAITIYIDPSDSKHKEALEQATGLELTVSKEEFFGGTRAVIHAKNILIDHSFRTLLAEEKDNFSF